MHFSRELDEDKETNPQPDLRGFKHPVLATATARQRGKAMEELRV